MTNELEAPRVPFVLVTGGKGGVGKTTVAANLGIELGREGHRVLLVDLDFGLANLDLMLGVTAGPTIEDVLDGGAEVDDCLVEGPGGVHLLPASNGSERMGDVSSERLERVAAVVQEASREFDVVVADSAAGVGPGVLRFASAADRVFVVTTPELAALTDAYGLIKALDSFGVRTERDIPTPELVVNHAKGIEEGQAIARKLRSICERFLARSPRQAGWIPRSAAVERSGSAQEPFALWPSRKLERLCVSQIASRVDRLVAPSGPRRQAAGGRPPVFAGGKIF